jgi:GT2 family glycosyltransferase
MKVSVIVPAYKRPKLLINCLTSLLWQTRKPNFIYITAQRNDSKVKNVVEEWIEQYGKIINVEFIIVDIPGQSHAMNQAIKRIKGGIVCFIDDDGEAEKDWIKRIVKWYEDPAIGGVGGFVYQHSEGKIDTGKSDVVGMVTWYGKVVGLHHYEIPEVKETMFFKGCNMSFRRSCLPYSDENLKYEQFYDEVDVGLTVLEKGYKLIFDPQIKVTHYDSQQFYIAKRRELKRRRVWSHNYNYIYVMLKHAKKNQILPILIYSFLFMRTTYSGLFPFLFLKFLRRKPDWDIFWASLQGKISGMNGYLRWRRMTL